MTNKTNAELLNEIKELETVIVSHDDEIVELTNKVKELGREVEELKAIIELAGKINKEFRGL